jgi:tripartite-type tricarboxylate transporter receptor subunit TctC
MRGTALGFVQTFAISLHFVRKKDRIGHLGNAPKWAPDRGPHKKQEEAMLKAIRTAVKAGVLALIAGAAASGSVFAEDYPTKPVHFVVAYSAGGGVDGSTRFIAQKLSEMWGDSVIVDNKPGAGGNIAGQFVAEAKPDGYTIYVAAGTVASLNPSVFANMGFDPATDLEPITLVVTLPSVLSVNAETTAGKTLPDLLQYANANPGTVNFGSSPAGSPDHLVWALLVEKTGAPITHIPYKGSSDAAVDLLGGRVQVIATSFGTVKSFIEAGQLIPIATTGVQRSPALPDVPTVDEQVPGFGGISSSIVFWATGGTPADIVQKIQQSVKKVLETEEAKEYFSNRAYIIEALSPTETKEWLADETKKHQEIAKSAGLVKQ